MRKLIIIPLLFILLSVQGQNGRYPFYRGVTAAGGEQTAEEILATDTWAWYIAATDNFTIVNDSISQWDDMSGNDRHFTQTTQTYRPRYLNNDSVYFEGSDNFLQYAFGNNPVPQPLTMYFVVNQLSYVGNSNIIYFNSNGIRQTSSDRLYINAGSLVISTSGQAPLNTWIIVTAVINSTNSIIKINNNEGVTGDAGTGNLNYVLSALNDAGGNADISIRELIVRESADTDTEINTIIEYLNNKYSIY